jgi:hypothetical protein
MKSTLILALATLAIAAPTGTVENRDLPGFDVGGSGIEDAWKALIPGLSGSDSADSPSTSDTPSANAIGIPGLGNSHAQYLKRQC